MLVVNLSNFNKRLKKRARICFAFTLVELLVVISIIAMLLSILMPSLQKAREQGRRVVCASQVKQITTSFMLYSMKYDGLIVQDRGIRMDKFGNMKYTDTIKQAQRPWDASLAVVWSMKETEAKKKIVACPSDPYPRAAPSLSFSPWYVGGEVIKRSYAPNPSLYNGLWRYMPKAIWGNGTGIPTRIAQVRRPSSVMLLGESFKGVGWNGDTTIKCGCVQGTNGGEVLGTYGNCEVWWATNSVIRGQKQWNTTHMRGGNFSFVDGHVRWCGAVPGEDNNSGQPFSGINYPLDWQWE